MNNRNIIAYFVILILPLFVMMVVVQGLAAASQKTEAEIVTDEDDRLPFAPAEAPFIDLGNTGLALNLESEKLATSLFSVDAVDDLAVIKTADPDPAIAGKTLTYTILVNNSGPSTATNVQVRDELPKAGIKLVNSFPTGDCVKNKGDYLCTAPSIGPGSAYTFTLVVSVPSDKNGDIIANTATLEASNPPDSDPSNNSSTIQTLITREVDLSIDKIGTPNPVPAGGLLNYTINIANAGPSDASGVVITDTLPPGITFFSSAECGLVNNDVVCDIGTLAAGNTNSVLIVAQVDPSLPDGYQINNTATVGSNELDLDLTNNSATEVTTVTNTGEQEADISITKVATPDPVVAGSNLTYLLTVTNNGPGFATEIVVTDTLPVEVSLVSTVTSWGPACSPVNPIVCTLTNLGIGASETITVVATVGSGVSGTIENVADVSAQQVDPQPQNNQANLLTSVIQPGEFPFLKLDLPDPVTAGTNLTYTLHIAGTGRPDLTNVVLTDALPSEVAFISVTPTLGSCSYSTGVVSCDLGDLPAGTGADVQILTRVDPAVTGQINNIATVDANEIVETQAEQTTTIVSSADLTIDIVELPNPAVAGENMTYTINVTNNGPSISRQAAVNATLPTGVTFISSPDCNLVGMTVVCSLGDVLVGETASALIVADVAPSVIGSISTIATVFSNTPDPDPASNSIVSGVSVIAEADLEVKGSAFPNQVIAGANLTYTLVVTNNGPSNAPSVELTDVLPAQVTLIAATAGQGTVCTGTAVVLCNLGNMPVGSQRVVTALVEVDSSATGALTNEIQVASDGIDPDPADNDLIIKTTTRSEADLAIDKTDVQDPVTAGNTVSYLLTLMNQGLSDAAGVVVTDTLPAGLTVVSTTPSQGGPCSGTTTLVCSIGTVAAGDDATVTIIAKVDSGQKIGVQNQAEVGSPTLDRNLSNNQDIEQTSVVVASDLNISISSNPNPAVPGKLLTYTLTISNSGPSDASAVKVVNVLPEQVQFISTTINPVGVCTGLTTITCELGTLKAKNTSIIKLKVRVADLSTGIIRNTASVEGAENDPDPSNNDWDEMTAVLEAISRILIPAIFRNYVVGEPNDICDEAHGIIPNMTYFFLPDDSSDWYKFDLPASGALIIELTNFSPIQGQMAVFRGPSCSVVEIIANKGDPGTVKTLNLGQQPAGHYIIFVSNDGAFTSIQPYMLRVKFNAQ